MVFSKKGKFEKTIINSLKHQKFWNIVEVLKYQKKKNGGSTIEDKHEQVIKKLEWPNFRCYTQDV